MAGAVCSNSDNSATLVEQQSEVLDGEAKKLIASLQFRNPGPQLKSFSEFDPEKSVRELRKINRLISDTGKQRKDAKRVLHDVGGRLLSSNADICDCQDGNCSGCHFPCVSCGSTKCGVECRCNRSWTYCKDVITTDSFILNFNQRQDTAKNKNK